jgi:hypothetical protein
MVLLPQAYIRAVARVFFKHDEEGAFMRAHQRLLQSNGWNHIQSEVLVSTPRRFGKTISVSMFAAAMSDPIPKTQIAVLLRLNFYKPQAGCSHALHARFRSTAHVNASVSQSIS